MNAVAKAAGWVKGELLDILPVMIFFLIGLHLIVFTKHLVLREQGIVYDGFWAATIGALLVAKVVLVVDKVPFMRRYSGRPLYRPSSTRRPSTPSPCSRSDCWRCWCAK